MVSAGSINLSNPDVLHDHAFKALQALQRAVGGGGWLNESAAKIVLHQFPELNDGQAAKILEALQRLGLLTMGGGSGKDHVVTDVREFSKRQLLLGQPVYKRLQVLDENDLLALNLVLETIRDQGSRLPGVPGTARTTLTIKDAVNQVLEGGAEPQKKDLFEKWLYRLGLCFVWGDGSNVVDTTIDSITPEMLQNGTPLIQWADRQNVVDYQPPPAPAAQQVANNTSDDESRVRQLLQIIYHLEQEVRSLRAKHAEAAGSLATAIEQREQLKEIVGALEGQLQVAQEALRRKTQVADAQSERIRDMTRELESLRIQERAAVISEDPEVAKIIAKYGGLLGGDKG